ncbi:nucleotide-binding protein [Planctomycetales bacterium ZRK34]|nr:nucleotide-binding protein [Planctomycetales bacterium ZRK34]
MLKVSKDAALERLQEIHKAMPRQLTWQDPRFTKWKALAAARLESVFGEDGRAVEEFNKIYFSPGVFTQDEQKNEEYARKGYQSGVRKSDDFFAAWEQRIKDYEPEPAGPAAEPAEAKDIAASDAKVFIVHGHDDGLKNEVARMLEKLDINAIILHEQANKGATTIEKLETNAADVDFAIVLLTPDDMGYSVSKGEGSKQPRARQNVVLELGFFYGMLGRSKVCAIIKGDIEQPSDYLGSLYIAYDEPGAWKYLVGKELIAAGIGIDLHRL